MNRNYIRREFIQISGSASIIGAASGVGATDETSTEEDFTVRGRKRTKVTYDPDVITVEIRKTSEDLVHRLDLDSATLTEEIEYNRSSFEEEDTLPERGTDVTTERWETEIAYEEEWQEYHRTRRAEREESPGGIGALDEDPEEHYWSYPVWTYSRSATWSGWAYEKKNPINVTFENLSGISEVTDVLDDDGWTSLDWRQGHEYRRWGYNHRTDSFESPTSYGTSRYRPNGGDHAKIWEFVDDRIGMEVHEDDEIPHSIVSRADPEGRMLDLFDDAGYSTFEDGYDFGNEKGDHNGEPSIVYP